MRGEMQLRSRNIKYARRDAITAPQDKISVEGRDGMRLRLQKIKYVQRDTITTLEDRISTEGCDYDSTR